MNKKQFLAALALYPGVTLDIESEQADNIQVDTPKGKVFAANFCHTMLEPFRNHGGQSWKPQAYKDMAERLAYGLADCDDPACDVCHEAVSTEVNLATGAWWYNP